MERQLLEQIATHVVDAAMEVHRELEPGLLESAYEMALCRELSLRNLRFERQNAMPVSFKGTLLDCGYRLDLIIEDAIIVELKAIDAFAPIHEAQLLTYLKLSGCHLGFLMNFNTRLLKQGLKRVVYRIPDDVQSTPTSSASLRSFAS